MLSDDTQSCADNRALIQFRANINCSPIICAANDALVIKANTSNKFFMTLKYSKAMATVNIPESTADHTHTHTSIQNNIHYRMLYIFELINHILIYISLHKRVSVCLSNLHSIQLRILNKKAK